MKNVISEFYLTETKKKEFHRIQLFVKMGALSHFMMIH